MAVTCDMNAVPTAPNHGDTITVTYTVSGNDAIDPSSATITGRVVVGGIPYDVNTSITLPGTPAASVTYDVPLCSGLSFVSTTAPAVFTSVVP
jgi:hypothetical protein